LLCQTFISVIREEQVVAIIEVEEEEEEEVEVEEVITFYSIR
jgi:hypothetical protein